MLRFVWNLGVLLKILHQYTQQYNFSVDGGKFIDIRALRVRKGCCGSVEGVNHSLVECSFDCLFLQTSEVPF